ncbi:hypothetical protein [Sphaerisporangium album]|uniref:hypothetical protein n=1 Tax=Sphaerisporangium album TaxID=509200 RepID=UPI001C68E58C|nr:hypothetical protein [Sphaerisporangium album]
MLAAVPLTDDERAAVDDGQAALDRLLGQLADVPTPRPEHHRHHVYRHLVHEPAARIWLPTSPTFTLTIRSPASSWALSIPAVTPSTS